MNGRKGVYDWEHEPSGERRSEFRSSLASDWQHSTQSTFAEPSRLDGRRARARTSERGLSRGAVVLIVAGSLVLASVGALADWWPALGRFFGR
ncbi:hypothetical protein [Aquabacterium humicola]|uniref:hypothetical protein n=1 Tax=Aquabacterium humicola TaxID=3237377 RepID=UPI0025427C7D|nr:hypothetical protein [Rubrivivax pictus]